MEHGEIRDLMFATREGKLDLSCDISLGVTKGDLRFAVELVLTLRNVGRVPVRAPYVRVGAGGWSPFSLFGPRPGAQGTTGFYSSRDAIIHVHDECGVARLTTGLDFRRTGLYDLTAAVNEVKKNDWNALVMAPMDQMKPEIQVLPPDITVHVSGFYGAENAAMKTFDLTIDKRALFEMFCKAQSIA
jgi:hypothetical protein